MYNHILVPLDGSELAAQILPQVEELAVIMKSRITLITVGDLLSVWRNAESRSTKTEESYLDITESISSQMKMSAEKYLTETASKMKNKGINVEFVYTVGVPAQEIINYAKNHGADLIAMATHGIGEVARPLGSVAEKVVSYSSTPVLLMRVIESESYAAEEESPIGPD